MKKVGKSKLFTKARLTETQDKMTTDYISLLINSMI